MIKIDVSKIKNWELIKEKHSEWYYKKIFPKIKNVPDELEKIYRKIYFNFKLRSMFEYIINPYIELLKKIISEEKNFSITKDLFFDYKVDEINFLSKIMKKEKKKKRKKLF
ncbi:hypothetical protein [Fusobacterium hwasookii]|uniref:hypothetical protein n=1 Tax=Fusobacterium hwasookii TaxID=1583098 RepID=UPI0004B3CA38|nr:hypothetical protein [Fusobacterium hwasookii]